MVQKIRFLLLVNEHKKVSSKLFVTLISTNGGELLVEPERIIKHNI